MTVITIEQAGKYDGQEAATMFPVESSSPGAKASRIPVREDFQGLVELVFDHYSDHGV